MPQAKLLRAEKRALSWPCTLPAKACMRSRHHVPAYADKCLHVAQVGEFETSLGDGWGLTTDGKLLIATESSPTVHFIDPSTFKTVRKITVTDDNRPVNWVNEVRGVWGLVNRGGARRGTVLV